MKEYVEKVEGKVRRKTIDCINEGVGKKERKEKNENGK